jgi:hypothetical protein
MERLNNSRMPKQVVAARIEGITEKRKTTKKMA